MGNSSTITTPRFHVATTSADVPERCLNKQGDDSNYADREMGKGCVGYCPWSGIEFAACFSGGLLQVLVD